MRAAGDGQRRRAGAAGRATLLLLALLPACGSGPGITPIRTAFNKGVYHHSRGELDAAIGEYEQAIAEDPGDLRARFNLAAIHDELGRAHRDAGRVEAAGAELAAAEAGYRAILQRDPDAVRASVNLAALAYERGDTAAGNALLRATITAHPDLALPRTALALRLQQAGQPEAARALLQQALALEPTDLDANLLHAEVCVQLGLVDAARASLQTALQREPDDPGALLALARLERDAGRDAAAIALLRQLLLGPAREPLAAHLLLADLYEQRGELEAAVYQLWRARDLDARQPAPVDYRTRLRALYQRLLAEPPVAGR